MSCDYAVLAKNITKQYQIYRKPIDRLKQFFLPKLAILFGKKLVFYLPFLAVDNVSFEIKKGESIGIIGRNGSGKSTLLQIISGVLNPTSGDLHVFGKVAALLELGSGFNPEFSGRENVYLNAAILGLSKSEIDARFEKIINFADIGDFLDQPVKFYSSGMYVRLAFSVIAHVDADILIVDEALAVGDAIFIQKCMRFIRDFKKNGTLILVSHDTGSIVNLCDKAIWIDKGRLQMAGVPKVVVEKYTHFTYQKTYDNDVSLENVNLEIVNDNAENKVLELSIGYESAFSFNENLVSAQGWKTGAGEIVSIQFNNLSSKNENSLFFGGELVELEIKANLRQDFDRPIIGFLLKDRLGQILFGENTLPYTDLTPFHGSAGEEIIAKFKFRLPMLPNGQYVMHASLANGNLYSHIQHHWLYDAMILTVASNKIRWGLVGLNFEEISLCK